jgi:uncharacterized cupin superfamily protein
LGDAEHPMKGSPIVNDHESRRSGNRAELLKVGCCVITKLGMSTGSKRPAFIISTESVPERENRYPNSDESCGHRRAIGRAAGLLRLGINLVRLLPGRRSSWPHAESREEEFVYVLEGDVDAWIDGVIYSMKPGDFAAFPSGTGICHTFINNSEREVKLLVGGDAEKSDNRIYYPLHPQRRSDMPWSNWWDDAPKRIRGKHDGMSDALRGSQQRRRKSAG